MHRRYRALSCFCLARRRAYLCPGVKRTSPLPLSTVQLMPLLGPLEHPDRQRVMCPQMAIAQRHTYAHPRSRRNKQGLQPFPRLTIKSSRSSKITYRGVLPDASVPGWPFNSRILCRLRTGLPEKFGRRLHLRIHLARKQSLPAMAAETTVVGSKMACPGYVRTVLR